MKFNELADRVTNEIIAELEKGKAVFQQPWRNSGKAKNYVTRRSYTGFNQFYLSMQSEKYTTPFYMTFKQARELGGNVKKGERSTPVVYWLVSVGTSESESRVGEEQENSTGKIRFVPFIYHVFNIDQVEGIRFNTESAEVISYKI